MNRPAEPLLFALGNFFSLAHVLFANVLLVGLLPWAVLMAVLGQLLHPVTIGHGQLLLLPWAVVMVVLVQRAVSAVARCF